MNQLKSLDLFELDRVLEDIAKTYAAPAATIWLKVTNNRKPTKVEYDKKVVEFVKKFENLIKNCYQKMNILIFFESIFQKNVEYGISSISAGK